MRHWLLLLVLVAAVSAGFVGINLPTPLLFGGLAGALTYALLRPENPLKLPSWSFQGGQAVVGVVVGASVDWSSLVALGPRWLIVVVVSCFSLIVSVFVGRLLIRKGVTPVTATFSSIAGGAAGLTAMADELDADARTVSLLQYLRLLVVLATMPIVVALVFGARPETGVLEISAETRTVNGPYVLLAILGGLALGKVMSMPSSAILGPLLVGALLTLMPYFAEASVPPPIQAVGYAAIGIQVGLKFTLASVIAIAKLVPTAMVTIMSTLIACAGLGWVLTLTTDASPLDAYLATTPGGIYAVMGTSAATEGDVTFVAASQILRLLIILGSAPFVAVYLRKVSDPTP